MVRVIASIVGILLLIPVVIFSHTIVLNCALALISMIAVYECLTIMKFPEKKQLLLPGILVAGVLPFCEYFDGQKFLMTVVFLYLAYLFLCKVLRPDTDLVHLICCAFMTFFVPYLFTSILFVRRLEAGLPYMMTIFLGAWGTDIFAYEVGRNFGKHKLAPRTSPHKTIEGSVGGAAAAVVIFLIYGICLERFFGYQVNLWLMAVYAVFCSAVAQFGDLAASSIKRVFGAKDFGKIIPGHGGILDRFDSILFLGAFVYLAATLVPIITR